MKDANARNEQKLKNRLANLKGILDLRRAIKGPDDPSTPMDGWKIENLCLEYGIEQLQEKIKPKPQPKPIHGIPQEYWRSIVSGAKTRNISHLMSIEEAWDKYESQGGLCALSGIPIHFKSKETPELSQTASFDRIDSSDHYTNSNTQWVHREINLMKRNLPEERFVELCTLIASHAGQRRTVDSGSINLDVNYKARGRELIQEREQPETEFTPIPPRLCAACRNRLHDKFVPNPVFQELGPLCQWCREAFRVEAGSLATPWMLPQTNRPIEGQLQMEYDEDKQAGKLGYQVIRFDEDGKEIWPSDLIDQDDWDDEIDDEDEDDEWEEDQL